MEDEEGIMEMFALFIKIGTNQANGAGQNRKQTKGEGVELEAIQESWIRIQNRG